MRRTVLTIVVVAAAVALLAGGTAGAKKMDGKVLYRTYCRPCHLPESPNGHYQPLTLIQDQWNRFFDQKFEPTHREVMAPGDEGQKLLEVLDEEMIKQIRDFAVDHAADSEHPMTCG